MNDFLIQKAVVLDGLGAPPYIGDLAVRNGRIAEVGPNLSPSGAMIVHAEGRYLVPGFIDAHCHDDRACLRDPQRLEKITQGVTTVVTGNCSFSLYPCSPSSKGALGKHFSGLLGETHSQEIFPDLDAYRSALGQMALNVVSLVGHAALRLATVGTARRAATQGEIGAMQELLSIQMKQGAAGCSIGLVYPPSAYAERDELVGLGETTRAHGGVLAAHIRSYEGELLAAIAEFLEVLRLSGAKGQLSHLQCAGRPHWGSMPAALGQLEEARQNGIDVEFDMYPYLAGSSYLLQLVPIDDTEAILQRSRDPAERKRLRKRVEGEGKVSLIGWNSVCISGSPSQTGIEGLSMEEAAERNGVEPFDLMLRLLEEDEGQTSIVLHQLSGLDLQAAFQHPLHMVGSDGLPRPGTKMHPRAYGTFPRVLGSLSRERGWFPIEEAIRKMTSAPARRFNLSGRGELRRGMVADLVLFDPDVEDLATYASPTALAKGVTDVWVAGRAVLTDGKPTGTMPGRLIAPGSME
ncbi:D-aminoacylase [bacterium]|nr:MAG: D-aminoacylase [bacterium]